MLTLISAKKLRLMLSGENQCNGCNMTRAISILAIIMIFSGIPLHPESFRADVRGVLTISADRPESSEPITIGIDGSVLVNLVSDVRFVRGVELEITAPQGWLQYRSSIMMMMFNNLNHNTAAGITDFEGRRIAAEPLPSRLRIIYHVPIRQQHGLRNTTSVTVTANTAPPDTLPFLFRLQPIEKGLPARFDQFKFNVTARPIYSDEGAVKITTRFPPNQRNRPFTVLIDDNVINSISEEIILKEGEHHLVILSDDYRNESRRFIVERTKVIDLTIELQDPAPLIVFEAPQNASIFMNNVQVTNTREPMTIDTGAHEVRFQIGDYTVIKTLNVQRGKTYRVSLGVDLIISEDD